MKKFILLLTLLMLAGIVSGQSFRKLRKAAEAFVENGKYEDAIEQYTHAIEVKPTRVDMYVERGKVFEALERYEEAYADYEKANVFDPDEADILYLLGRVSNRMEKYEQALSHLNHASRVSKREAKIYPEKVKTLFEMGDYEMALKVSDTAMLFKESSLNYYLRGLVYESLKNDLLAKKDFEKSVKKDKEFIDARLSLANLLIRTGELDDAMEHCAEVLEMNDRNTEAYLTRSKIYIEQLDYPSAINDISKNILIEAENPEHYLIRGTYYQEFNQHQYAINDFSKAIALNEDNPDYYFKRANSYEEIMDYEKAAKDYSTITELSEFNMQARKMLNDAEKRLYEINRETNPPDVQIISPDIKGSTVEVRGDADKMIISGTITEESPMKALLINDKESLFEKGSDGKYQFLTNLNIKEEENIRLVAVDDYDNLTDLEYTIIRTEITPPEISILAPYAGDDNQIFLDNNQPNLFIEGKIKDNSLIKSIFIEGVTASYAVERENPTFTATVNILNKNKITVIAEDVFGNREISEFSLNRDAAAISADNPMGKTWVVFVENSNYSSFASLDGPVKDVTLMKRALANYKVHKIIHKKDLTKDEMQRFFSIDLRDLIKSNQVKSLLIWYAGHGKFVNDVGYWIPVDAKRDDEFTYFNINTLRASMEPYTNVLTHTLVITDACESGPGFYTAMRSTPKIRSCNDWKATQYKSSQVFSSAGKELASDDSQFARTFANTLESNPNACMPIEEIVSSVTVAVTNANKPKPKFGLISGLRDEDGTFFFVAK